MTIEHVPLWQNALAARQGDLLAKERDRLRVAFELFRSKITMLASRIAITLPNLTVHDVTHLDALWETADLIAGPNYPLNPMEAFVFGGAILLHDAALCFEAYDGGADEVRRTPQWKDAYAAEKEKHPDSDEASFVTAADFSAIRLLHATQAAELVEKMWIDPDNGQPIFLIDDSELRKRFGPTIGRIASSHHWPIERVASELQDQLNSPGEWPADWRIDPIKLACLLRCADAAHIDDRRAPDFLHALIRRQGISLTHWKAQNWLTRADIDQADASGEAIVFTSTRDFSSEDADAWWVAYDAINLLDAEIRTSNSLLQSRPQRNVSPQFKIRRVAGSASPEQLSVYVRARDWKPWSAKLHVGNVEQLVKNLGGENLYGKGTDQLYIALRELIQNARDAIIARNVVDPQRACKIRIRLKRTGSRWFLEVEDNGVGMSHRIMTGPLLDFGSSFWITDLVEDEFPGLRASGFKSIGQFGIGFYSIFMVARKVSISSRRWDRGLDSVCTLRFPKGLTLRPIVSLGRTPAFTGDTSTIVSCEINDNLITDMATVNVVSGITNEPDLDIKLCDYLAVITAGLDVVVELEVGEEVTQVHAPILELTTRDKTEEWLRRISLSEYRAIPTQRIENDAGRLRPLISNSRIVGLAAVDVSKVHALNVKTVGGLATSVGGRYSSSFVGFIDYYPNSAKRESVRIVASTADLTIWANEQVELLKRSNLSPIEWCLATCSLSDLDVDPSSILRAAFLYESQIAFMGLGEIFSTIQLRPLAIMKTARYNRIETYGDVKAFGGLLTFLPIKNSNFLSLDGFLPPVGSQIGVPKIEFSFIQCLARYCRDRNRELVYEVKPGVSSSFLGSVDALVLSLKS